MHYHKCSRCRTYVECNGEPVYDFDGSGTVCSDEHRLYLRGERIECDSCQDTVWCSWCGEHPVERHDLCADCLKDGHGERL